MSSPAASSLNPTGLPLFSLSISPFVRCLPCLWPLFFCLYMPGLWPCCFSSFAAIFNHVEKSGNVLPHFRWRHNRGVSPGFPENSFLQNKSLYYAYNWPRYFPHQFGWFSTAFWVRCVKFKHQPGKHIPLWVLVYYNVQKPRTAMPPSLQQHKR